MAWGSGPSPPARPGCTKSNEPLGPCVSALEPPPPPWRTCGALWGAPPPSPSLCCHVSLLPNRAPWPFLVLLGGGAGFLLPHALGPQPGNGGHQVPSLHRTLFALPCFPGAVIGVRLWPGTVSRWLQSGLAGARNQPPHLLPWDWYSPHQSLPPRRTERGDLLSLGEGNGVCPAGPQSPASLGSAAAGSCFPHRALTSHICLNHPRPWGHHPSPGVGGRGRTRLWCHINMYMCI